MLGLYVTEDRPTVGLPISSVVIPGRIAAAPISKTSREIYQTDMNTLLPASIDSFTFLTLQTSRMPWISSSFKTLMVELMRTLCSETGILLSA